MPRVLLIFIAVLLIIPISFLVFKLVATPQSPLSPTLTNNSNKTTPTPNPTLVPAEKRPPTEDERYILSNIVKDSLSPQERKQFLETLAKAAILSEDLDVDQCSPTPVVLTIGANQQLTLLNPDSTEHTLNIKGFDYKVPPKSSINITTNFGEGNTVLPYSCDQTSLAGVIWIQQ